MDTWAQGLKVMGMAGERSVPGMRCEAGRLACMCCWCAQGEGAARAGEGGVLKGHGSTGAYAG
ncbi:hypothetical protein CRYUN_Cryun09bG0137600 [Craigia yunnanensis]